MISSGETTYSTSGRIDTFRQTRVIVRRPPPPPPRRVDPLAQSFTTDSDKGLFLSSVDLYITIGSHDAEPNVM